jgi:flavin reductase (DIM6/NTAB) family NADH-FMN oxidoreductase RutF
MHPSRFLALISKTNHTYGVAKDSTVLAVHVLRASDHALAAHFGELTGDEVDKFAGLEVSEGPGRVPLIAGLDWFAGRVLRQFDLGDHVGFLLAPHDGSAARRDEPQLGLQDVHDLDAAHEA